jgi:hypothetical protein
MYIPFLWNNYSPERISLCSFCFDNNDKKVQDLLQKPTDYHAVELMILVLKGEHFDLRTFYLVAPLLTKDDVQMIFSIDEEEHTLLTYCLKQTWKNTDRMKVRVKTLLECGADWNQVAGGVIALTYIVSTNHIDLLQWCISMGADITKGQLLVHASCWQTETSYAQLYEKFIEDNAKYDYEYQSTILYTPAYTNDIVFAFLIDMGLDVNERLDEHGMTPLLAACCEGNTRKVEQLLLAGASMTAQCRDGMTVWSWSKRHMEMQLCNDQVRYRYRLHELLFSYWKKEKQFYVEMIAECVMDKESVLSSVFHQLGTKTITDYLVCNIK